MPLDTTNVKEKILVKKHEELINKMSLEIARYKEKHALNIFKKAKLGNSFKWTLREAGYDSGYIDQWTNWLMVRT